MHDTPDNIRTGAIAWHRITPVELFLVTDMMPTEWSPYATLWDSTDPSTTTPEAGTGGTQETLEQEKKARLSAPSWWWEILGSSIQISLIP